MVLVNHKTLREHLPWIVISALVTIGATAWYIWAALQLGSPPSGSSAVGLSCGVFAAALIVFECLFWLRKQLRTWLWLGSVRIWLQAHLWLGLLTLPLALLHTGFNCRAGWLSSALTIVLLLVVVSGVFGLWLQNTIPTRLKRQVEYETIHSQIHVVLDQLQHRAAELAVVGTGSTDGLLEPRNGPAAIKPFLSPLSVTHSFDSPTAFAPSQKPARAAKDNLKIFFIDVVKPFLKLEDVSRHELFAAPRAEAVFKELRATASDDQKPVVDALEQLCEQRRQLAWQDRLFVRLHAWLWFHLPLSAALLVLLAAHAWLAILYW